MNLTEITQAIEDYMNAGLGVNGEITRRAEEAVKELKAYPACEQIRWERDVAIQQLADLGYSLGEKPKASCSETPNNSDCISRQAAIDEIEYELEMINSALDSITLDFNARERLRQRRGEARGILNSIQQLPSVQPEVISCKDCVNYRNYYDTKEQEERYVCALDGFIWKPEGYCSYAERKTADDNDKTD